MPPYICNKHKVRGTDLHTINNWTGNSWLC